MTDFIEIKDIHVPELDLYARLSEGQLRHYNEPDQGLFIAESPMIIRRALEAGYRPLSMLAEHKLAEGQGRELISLCGDIPVYVSEREVLEQITGYALTRGMLCAMYRKPLPGAAEVCVGARRVAVLENVMNPTNVGAVFRSAAALGMDGILLTPGSSDPLYRRAIRVSMGTVFQIPWAFLESVHYPELLHALGFRTAAMALREDSVSLADPRLGAEERLAIVLGTEGDGLAADNIADCDYTVRIPMSHGVDSLNVAAASAVAFWQLGRLNSGISSAFPPGREPSPAPPVPPPG